MDNRMNVDPVIGEEEEEGRQQGLSFSPVPEFELFAPITPPLHHTRLHTPLPAPPPPPIIISVSPELTINTTTAAMLANTTNTTARSDRMGMRELENTRDNTNLLKHQSPFFFIRDANQYTLSNKLYSRLSPSPPHFSSSSSSSSSSFLKNKNELDTQKEKIETSRAFARTLADWTAISSILSTSPTPSQQQQPQQIDLETNNSGTGSVMTICVLLQERRSSVLLQECFGENNAFVNKKHYSLKDCVCACGIVLKLGALLSDEPWQHHEKCAFIQLFAEHYLEIAAAATTLTNAANVYSNDSEQLKQRTLVYEREEQALIELLILFEAYETLDWFFSLERVRLRIRNEPQWLKQILILCILLGKPYVAQIIQDLVHEQQQQQQEQISSHASHSSLAQTTSAKNTKDNVDRKEAGLLSRVDDDDDDNRKIAQKEEDIPPTFVLVDRFAKQTMHEPLVSLAMRGGSLSFFVHTLAWCNTRQRENWYTWRSQDTLSLGSLLLLSSTRDLKMNCFDPILVCSDHLDQHKNNVNNNNISNENHSGDETTTMAGSSTTRATNHARFQKTPYDFYWNTKMNSGCENAWNSSSECLLRQEKDVLCRLVLLLCKPLSSTNTTFSEHPRAEIARMFEIVDMFKSERNVDDTWDDGFLENITSTKFIQQHISKSRLLFFLSSHPLSFVHACTSSSSSSQSSQPLSNTAANTTTSFSSKPKHSSSSSSCSSLSETNDHDREQQQQQQQEQKLKQKQQQSTTTNTNLNTTTPFRLDYANILEQAVAMHWTRIVEFLHCAMIECLAENVQRDLFNRMWLSFFNGDTFSREMFLYLLTISPKAMHYWNDHHTFLETKIKPGRLYALFLYLVHMASERDFIPESFVPSCRNEFNVRQARFACCHLMLKHFGETTLTSRNLATLAENSFDWINTLLPVHWLWCEQRDNIRHQQPFMTPIHVTIKHFSSVMKNTRYSACSRMRHEHLLGLIFSMPTDTDTQYFLSHLLPDFLNRPIEHMITISSNTLNNNNNNNNENDNNQRRHQPTMETKVKTFVIQQACRNSRLGILKWLLFHPRGFGCPPCHVVQEVVESGNRFYFEMIIQHKKITPFLFDDFFPFLSKLVSEEDKEHPTNLILLLTQLNKIKYLQMLHKFHTDDFVSTLERLALSPQFFKRHILDDSIRRMSRSHMQDFLSMICFLCLCSENYTESLFELSASEYPFMHKRIRSNKHGCLCVEFFKTLEILRTCNMDLYDIDHHIKSDNTPTLHTITTTTTTTSPEKKRALVWCCVRLVRARRNECKALLDDYTEHFFSR